MAKSKYSPALFEVMNRQKNTGKLGVPKWWKGGPPQESPQPEPGPDVDTTADQPDQSAAGPSTVTQPEFAQPEDRVRLVREERVRQFPAEAQDDIEIAPGDLVPSRFPVIRVADGRIRATLSVTHAVAMCGALLVLLLAAYQVGRGFSGSGAAGTPDESLAFLNEKPDASVLNEPAGRADSSSARAAVGPVQHASGGTGGAAPPPTDTEVLKVGLHYVLLDSYPPDALKTAEFVSNWLATTHKIESVLRMRNKKYWLIGKTGFDYSVPGEKEKCAQYVEKIKALGNDCRKAIIAADKDRGELLVYGFAAPMVFKVDE